MLIPIAALFVALSGVLVVLALARKSKVMLAFLDVLWWLLAFVSAFLVGWAWIERSYSENWAMLGFFFFSVPIIITTAIMAVVVIVAAKARKIERIRTISISLYLLLLFLGAQAVVGFLAGR